MWELTLLHIVHAQLLGTPQAAILHPLTNSLKAQAKDQKVVQQAALLCVHLLFFRHESDWTMESNSSTTPPKIGTIT
jgi:hypothetical protein